MESIYFETIAGRVHALRFGTGPELLIALHGFSNQARMFRELANSLHQRYTLVAPDLPFHGQTNWQKDHFSKTDLLEIMAQILEREQQTQCTLLGFSFGARLAQGLSTAMGGRVSRLVLLSPDGVKTVGMQLTEQTPRWLRQHLARAMKQGDALHYLLRLLSRWNLLSPPQKLFLDRHLGRPDRLARSIGCGLSLDAFVSSPQKIQESLRASGIDLLVFAGAKDQFLDLDTLTWVYAELPNARLYMLENEGHALSKSYLEAVSAAL